MRISDYNRIYEERMRAAKEAASDFKYTSRYEDAIAEFLSHNL